MVKRSSLLALGLVSPFVLMMVCAVALALVGVTGWLIFAPAEKSRVIKIATVGPLPAIIAIATPTATETLVHSTEEPASPPQSEPAVTPEAEMATDNHPPQAETPPLPTSTLDVEQVLGFTLPPGSVNSVSQENIATRLVIPALGLDAPVVLSPIENQTWQVDHLGQAIGHLEGTAPPGSDSNIVLAGHVTLARGVYGPFAGLGRLVPGDLLVVYENDKKFEYVVDGQQMVGRTAVDVTYPSETGQITLITCTTWNNEESRYDQRLVVRGHLLTNK